MEVKIVNKMYKRYNQDGRSDKYIAFVCLRILCFVKLKNSAYLVSGICVSTNKAPFDKRSYIVITDRL